MTDPWSVKETDLANKTEDSNSQVNGVPNGHSAKSGESDKNYGFEDSFIGNSNNNNGDINSSPLQLGSERENKGTSHQPLPDSQTYLEGLESKLKKLKKSSKLVEALSEKRDDCLRSLVENNSPNGGLGHNDLLLDLEASILNNDSAVHNLYRQIQPVQPVTVGETVHIVKYDQLEEQRLELEAAEVEDEEDLPASR